MSSKLHKQIGIRLDPELWARVRVAALTERMTALAWVTRALEAGLLDAPGAHDVVGLPVRVDTACALEVAGMVHPGEYRYVKDE